LPFVWILSDNSDPCIDLEVAWVEQPPANGLLLNQEGTRKSQGVRSR
jgi:hypothetical protein